MRVLRALALIRHISAFSRRRQRPNSGHLQICCSSARSVTGLALRTPTMTYWKHLPGSLFSVLEDLNLLQGDEAAGHHLVKDGQETVDAVFAIDDFD